MLEKQQHLGRNRFPIQTAAMGNAATCQACGSQRALKGSGSSRDLNLDADFYRAADCASDIDDCPVRGGGTNRGPSDPPSLAVEGGRAGGIESR